MNGETAKRKPTKAQIAAVAVAGVFALLPLSLIVAGIVKLFKRRIFDFSFVLVYLILPLAALFTIAGIAFGTIMLQKSKPQTAGRLVPVATLVTAALLIGWFFVLFFAGLMMTDRYLNVYHGGHAAVKYTSFVEKEELPSIAFPDGAQEKKLFVFDYEAAFASGTAQIYFADYPADRYEDAKSRLAADYPTDAEELLTKETKTSTCPARVTVGDWSFRAATAGRDFPLCGGLFIACCDRLHRIAIIQHVDAGLDFVYSFENFINEELGWSVLPDRITG